MKRVEAHIKAEKLRPVVDALKACGVGGVTVAQVRGRGSNQVPVVRGLKGTAKFVVDFNSKNLVYTIVDDSKVDQVINAIIDAAGTGEKGEGKIFVAPIEDAVDIGTKQRGAGAL